MIGRHLKAIGANVIRPFKRQMRKGIRPQMASRSRVIGRIVIQMGSPLMISR